MAIDNIDPRELSLQDAAGMQLVHVIRRIIEEINNGGDTPTPTPSDPTGIYYCTFDVTTKDEITNAISNDLLPVCFHADKMHYLVAYQYGVYTFATISRDRGIISRIDCRVNGWSVQEPLEIQKLLTFDYAPTQDSVNPVTSGGVWTALQNAGGGTPSDVTPNMDGVANAGVSDAYSRGDHRHPSDTSRLEKNQGSNNANKFMVVDNNGDIVPSSVPDATIKDAVDDYLDDHPTVTGTFTNAAKMALLTLLQKVAYIDDNGQDYYDTLESELFAVAVSSISAVFTQGSATIYNTDPLDSLKQYLVVTATYVDSSTSVIPSTSYILSGTLTEGTSTITVSYGGKTDTFTVTVTEYPLPVGYTMYDYVVNVDVNDTGIILNTHIPGIYCGSGYGHELTFMVENAATSTSYPMYGLRDRVGSDAQSRAAWSKTDTNGNFGVNYNGLNTGFIFTMQTFTKYKCVTENNKFLMNDVVIRDNMETSGWTPYESGNIQLWGIQSGSDATSGRTRHIMRIYGFKVKDLSTGNYVADMIPCKNSSNVAGLYDTIRQSFYTANTPAKLNAGND